MTREEAIKQLDGADIAVLNRDFFKFNQAIIMAISALRQQDVTDTDVGKNEPLTLDELREIYDGEEGAVWVKNGQACFPAILDIYDGEIVAVWSAEPDYFEERHYGKNWLAYRQKPEEGTV